MPTKEEMQAWMEAGCPMPPPWDRPPPPPGFVGKGVIDLKDGPYPGQVADQPCEMCKAMGGQETMDGVKWRCSRTAYVWDGEGENPNRCLALCDVCAAEYDQRMDDQWSDYYSGLL